MDIKIHRRKKLDNPHLHYKGQSMTTFMSVTSVSLLLSRRVECIMNLLLVDDASDKLIIEFFINTF